jgi:serine/threonine protein kinase
VTDFCEGVLLEDVISKRIPIGVPRVLKIMSQLLRVLDAAHSLHIVHRDIKSANVMIEGLASNFSSLPEPDDLNVRVLDFGIAKLQEQLEGNQSSTLEGVSIGTPVYMSPEQASGEGGLDHRVDLYAAGVLMYELLSGDVPFLGETVIQTLLKHLTQPPPSFEESLGIPLEVEHIVVHALEKEKERRYQTGAEFAAACEAAFAHLSNPETFAADLSAQKELVQETGVSSAQSVVGKKILCLDDNEMILEIMRHLLEKEGYTVITANNFSVIHKPVFEDQVDLMLCDVQMPGLPGNKICQMLKQAKRELKIVLFSNIPERDLQALAKEARADSWISKNAKPGEWLTSIKALLS